MIQVFFFPLSPGDITKAETSVSLEIKIEKKLSQAPFEFQSLASEFIIDFWVSSVAAYGIPVMPVSQETPSLSSQPKFLYPGVLSWHWAVPKKWDHTEHTGELPPASFLSRLLM